MLKKFDKNQKREFANLIFAVVRACELFSDFTFIKKEKISGDLLQSSAISRAKSMAFHVIFMTKKIFPRSKFRIFIKFSEPNMDNIASTNTAFVLEESQEFSLSMLWKLQRNYFSQRGADAWKNGEVPHYVTSNPTIANAYAELAFEFWRDQKNRADDGEALTICELGAGCGRFAFYFLKRLSRLCEQHGVAPRAFRYVLTDFTQNNLDAWRCHPRFQPFFDCGMLDIALFDVGVSSELILQIAGITIGPGTLRRPLVAIANYVFDSVPQELFYFKNGEARACRVSLRTDEDPATLDAAALLERVRLRYEYQAEETASDDSDIAHLIDFYRRHLDQAHVLLPASGARCLRRLKALSRQGIFLLSADKGEHALDKIGRNAPPGLVCHGSFSLSVNYHALRLICERDGGMALLQSQEQKNLNVVGLMMLDQPAEYRATQGAWEKHIADFSPGDFLAVSKHARRFIPGMQLDDMLAYVRLGHHDSHLFANYLPRLQELAPDLTADERHHLAAITDKVWDMYFPLGEDSDLAYAIACLLYEIDRHAHALIYFSHSLDIYGAHTGTCYNMAVCEQFLGHRVRASTWAKQALEIDASNRDAQQLLMQLQYQESGVPAAQMADAVND